MSYNSAPLYKRSNPMQAYTLLYQTSDKVIEESYLLPPETDKKAQLLKDLAGCKDGREKRSLFMTCGAALTNTRDLAEGRQRPAVIEFSKDGKIMNCLSYEHGVLSLYGKNPYDICAFNYAPVHTTKAKSKGAPSVFTIASIVTVAQSKKAPPTNLPKRDTSFEMRKYLFDRNRPMTDYLKTLKPQEGISMGICSQRERGYCTTCRTRNDLAL